MARGEAVHDRGTASDCGAVRSSSEQQSRTLFAIFAADILVTYGLAAYGGQHRAL